MSDNMPHLPTTHSAVLGDVVFRADNDPPWISIVPTPLCPSEMGYSRLEVYIAGESAHPDPQCLYLAEQTALNLLQIEARCQRTLAQNPGKNPEQEFVLMWLSISLDNGAPIAEATFTRSSDSPSHDEIYTLWIVSLNGSTPFSVRHDYW